MLGNIMKLIIYLFFLSPFTYDLLLLVVQAEKEGIMEKRREYFQTQLLFLGLQLFCGDECFSWIGKIAVLPVEVSIGIWEGVSFWCQEAYLFSICKGGACGVMVIVAGIGHSDTSSNPGLIAFHIALIPLGKVWIQLFSLQLWVNSRAD